MKSSYVQKSFFFHENRKVRYRYNNSAETNNPTDAGLMVRFVKFFFSSNNSRL